VETRRAVSRKKVLASMALLLAMGSACAHGPQRTQQQPQPGPSPFPGPLNPAYFNGQPSETYGPSPDLQTQSYGPTLAITRSVVLVLGPGQAKAFAEAGVIRALSDAKIKIAGIYGVEMGALIGALYANDGSVNHLEWELLHFKEDTFGTDENAFDRLLKRRPSADQLEEDLKKAFGDQDLSKSKIPMKVLVQPEGAATRIYEQGTIRQILRAALATSNTAAAGAPENESEEGFEPVVLDGKESASAAMTKPFPIEDARAFAATTGSLVIAIDVLDPKDSDRFPELKGADEVIRPSVQEIGLKDYQKRTDATFAGKSATLEKLDEIKRLVNPS
jgi:predicted acylesterase/phospholipase RssA